MVVFTVRLLAPLLVILLTTATMSYSQQCICTGLSRGEVNCVLQSLTSLRLVLSPGPSCENVTVIDVRSNKLTSLDFPPGFLRRYKNANINAAFNMLISINDLDGWNGNTLFLNKNKISHLSSSVLGGNLRDLSIDYNYLRTLNLSLANNLNRVHSINNKLEKLYTPVGKCSLTYLNLNFNNLSTLPQDLYLCTKLEVVLLSNNLLTSLNISSLSTLHLLNAEHNSLQEFVFPSSNCSLLWVKLSHNNLSYLSLNLYLCEKLLEIGTSYNLLTSLNVSSLSKLRVLNAEHNYLQEFVAPSTTCSLERVHLSYNNLSTLPSELSMCSNLKELIITNNAILRLPEVVLHLLTLRPRSRDAFDETEDISVDLKGNSLTFLSARRSFKRFAGEVGYLRTYFTSDCACAVVRTFDRQKAPVKYCISAMCTSNPNETLWTFR